MKESPHIYYRSGYKYQLTRDAWFETQIKGYCVETRYISLAIDGTLCAKIGYAWDGPSGPTVDTKDSMRGSLVHDVLYQLMREEYIPATCRPLADKELERRCEDDGMWAVRAEAWYLAVRLIAAGAADPANKKIELSAP